MPIKYQARNTCSSSAVTEKTRFVSFSGRLMACLWVGTVRTDRKMDREGLWARCILAGPTRRGTAVGDLPSREASCHSSAAHIFVIA